ncbi:MAG: L-aspartate oxidase [Desulfovibrionaceae bacterium]
MAITRLYTPVLIIGSGIAGCTTALTLADSGHEVTLLNASPSLQGGNSELAQGGIIYQTESGDDAKALEHDIMVAGHAYNYRKAVYQLCHMGPETVRSMLIERCHIDFDRKSDQHYHLTREGGHSAPRILHRADFTGRSIMEGLTDAVQKHPLITVLTRKSAIDLLTTRHHARKSDYRYHVENRCVGAYIFDEDSNQPMTILADWTVLATGGAGQVFLHSTNAAACVGSGISMAHRAGVTLSNLEFMQFHPTALYEEMSNRRPLITEAMRGEGARLLDAYNEPLMQRYDKRGDLAPRDVVAQSMLHEMLSTGAPCLYLDASHIQENLQTRFPTVFASCAHIGIDIRTEPIPVVPAAHYFCGGILADARGRTTLDGLYSVGECSCTGLHGANRLASTSLLEGLVWGACAGTDIAKRSSAKHVLSQRLRNAIPDWEPVGDEQNDDPALVAQDWASIRNTMWNYVGISRSTARLRRAFEDLRNLSRHIHDFYKRTRLSRRLVDLFHGSHTAYVITQAALRNKTSLGCHHRVD